MTTSHFTIALAQINPVVGDIEGNAAKIREAYLEGCKQGADLVVCPELALVGYSPEDLVLREQFQYTAMEVAQVLASLTSGQQAGLLFGSIWREGDGLYNAALLAEHGAIRHKQYKWALPNYGVFDEMRVFTPGPLPEVITFRGVRLAIMVCEDFWRPAMHEHLAQQKPELAVAINASPYEFRKRRLRTECAERAVATLRCPVAYVNMVGGQDELVFDGNSFVMSAEREIVHNLVSFGEQVEAVRLVPGEGAWQCEAPVFRPFPRGLASIYHAMVLGLRDYIEKNRFKGIVLGLSGGVDSAITAAVAVDAIGPERVHCVMLPSPYTSQESLDDAAECARLLGVKLDTISITQPFEAMKAALSGVFAGLPADTTEENIQARIRGNLLMALSNKLGLMVLTTGNKSEMSVGYATLYGDTCGGYSVLKDVYKTTVYKLCRWRNQNRPFGALGSQGRVVPENVITKAPTAELKHNQKDQDSLPPYEMLDAILECLVERQMGVGQTSARGHAREVVEKIAKMLYAAEYKRRQAPPGVKISRMAFGRDRRYPITNRFRE